MMSVALVVAASVDIVFSNCVIDMNIRSSAVFIYIGWTF